MNEREPEIWAGVPGYEDRYEVSSWGRIRSLKKKMILKPDVNKHGYLRIDMSIKGERVRRMIHRLVAAVWLPNPKNLKEVNHEDFDKKNNYIGNLSWMDHSSNMIHSWSRFSDVEF